MMALYTNTSLTFAGVLADSTDRKEPALVRTVGFVWKTAERFLWGPSGKVLSHVP